MTGTADADRGSPALHDVLDRVRSHEFHPVDEGFTSDRTLGEHGIADLADDDWRVRLLAIRDLVRAGIDAADEIAAGLADDDVQVRYVCATALGALRAASTVDELEAVAREDPDSLARSQAVVALGQIGDDGSLDLLRALHEDDPSRDVRHQAELATDRIEKGMTATDELRRAYEQLDLSSPVRPEAGNPAPTFSMPDTEGGTWSLAELRGGDDWLVLIWVFADWCPVCHTEFDELIELREAFAEAGVAVATVECHDVYRGRVMTGREIDPEYWFAEESFKEQYAERIWWPHLLDRAGVVGVRYGVDPMAYAVHAEYINRPATIVVDGDDTVRFAYYGTYWGDRPSVEETLEMIRTGEFDFRHPDRRTLPDD